MAAKRSAVPTLFIYLLFFLHYKLAGASSENACSRLSAAYGERVTNSSTPEKYNALRMYHMSATAWGTPTCIYTPESVQALVEGFRICTADNASIAIRGQGHSPLRGWANINDGVTIVTSNMKEISYDSNKGNVVTAMGNSWGEIYEYTESYGRVPNGARHFTVGIATILGGGLSHLSSKYGFPADGVVEFELLVANGTLTKVTAKPNADLFSVLKAGSTNFGIVTRVTLATYPIGATWGGTLVYSNAQRSAVMRAISSYQKDGQLDTNSAILSYLGVSNDTIYVNLVYLNCIDRPKAFQPFFDIPSIADTTALHQTFSELIRPGLPLGVPRWTQGEVTFLLDEQLYVDVVDICQKTSDGTSGIQGWSMILMPQPISKSMVEESWKRGSNAMAKNLKAEPQMWFTINIGWMLAQDDEKVSQTMNRVLKEISDLAQSRGLWHQFIFANDASETQTPLQSYGTNTFRMMKRISREVDPNGFFQTHVPGGYKVGL